MYRCIVADPPWSYGDKLRMDPNVKRSAGDVYHVMSTDDICKLARYVDVTTFKDVEPVHQLSLMNHFIADDAVLWLWVTNPFLLNGDGARVCRAWGFEPKQLFTWVKGNIREDAIVGALGMGHYLRVDTEHLILATRGRATSLVQQHNIRNYCFVAPKSQHSTKPEIIFEIAEALTPGPRLELFARRRREGWDAIGDQL